MRIASNDFTPMTVLNQRQTSGQTNVFDKALKAAEEANDTKDTQGMSETEKVKLQKACQEFESLFIFQMLKGMRKTIPQSDFMPNNTGKTMFEGMFDQKMAQQMSQSDNSIGLAKILYEQMTKFEK